MPGSMNRQILLASRPVGWVGEENFESVETAMPQPGDGELLARVIYLSLDPYMRGRMNDMKSYVPPFQIGEVVTGRAIGEVISSRHPGFAEGDIVHGMLGWEEYSLSDGSWLTKIEPGPVPLATHLGALGMPGFTAYAGLLSIGKPKAGETVFVSAASGAVGSMVGQIAKIKGCRVVGSAGSDAKVRYLTEELGFDAAFNYKTIEPYQALGELCGQGIDIDFENVGGKVLEAAIAHMNDFGRIVFCGAISHYNDVTPPPGPRNLAFIIGKRLRVQGFIVTDHASEHGAFEKDVTAWLAEGLIKARETIVEGLENAPGAFVGLFKGENFGKLVVKVSDES